jgi:hypothetical protein
VDLRLRADERGGADEARREFQHLVDCEGADGGREQASEGASEKAAETQR